MTRRGTGPVFRAVLGVLGGTKLLSFGRDVRHLADFLSQFQLHVAVAATVIGVVLFAAGLRQLAAIAVLLTTVSIATILPANTLQATPAAAGGTVITLATFNVWVRNGDLEKAARIIAGADADIVVLQEIEAGTRELLAALAAEYPYQKHCPCEPCDIAILARQPWRASGMIAPDGSHAPAIWATFERDNRQFTVVGTHFDRPNARRHSRQLDALVESLAPMTRPLILAGDFNATPWSPGMTRLAGKAGLRLLAGLRPTWPAQYGLPQFPIDHVLVSAGIRNLGVRRGRFAGSDHLPVIARLGIDSLSRADN